MQILKSQANALYDMIVQHGFSPSSFTFGTYHDKKRFTSLSTIIEYNNAPYFFSIFSSEREELWYDYSPGEDKLIVSAWTASWGGITYLFQSWLMSLRREITEVDKWKQLQEGIPSFKLASDDPAGQFSYEEVILIETKVRLLKEKLKQIPLTTEQFNTLNEKLDHCIELAKTANKFDWASYFIGVITNIIITLSVTQDNAKHIWEAVKHVFNHFFLM